MAVTNLTGYIWVGNNTVNTYGSNEYFINFISNSTNYTSMTLTDDGYEMIYYNGRYVYVGGWRENYYKTVTFTGGTDVTNTDLINWLEANGTLTTITDLTGYIWVGIDYVNPNGWNKYYIDFVSNSTNFTSISLIDTDQIEYNDENVYYGGWYDIYKTITITGGTDVTNTNLINWLVANGTLTAPPAPPSIADKLLQLNQAKEDIKDALERKGFDMTGVIFGRYPGKIDQIQTGGGGTLPKLDTPVSSGDKDGISWSTINDATIYKVYYDEYSSPTKESDFVPVSSFSASPSGTFFVSPNDTYEGIWRILNGKTVAVSAVAEGFLESDLSQSYSIYVCFVEGTAITLADRTTKNIENITYDDDLLVWDFDNATFTSAKPIWIMREQQSKSYTRLTFDDNTELNLVGSKGRVHRVYDYDGKQFQYGNYIPLNNRTFKDNKATPKLISVDEIKEPVSYYNIITTYHMNLFANGVLTSCGYNNMYPIEDMAFVKDDRELVTKETYGNIKDKWYDGLRLGEQDLTKRSVNKAHEYISRLEVLDVNRH